MFPSFYSDMCIETEDGQFRRGITETRQETEVIPPPPSNNASPLGPGGGGTGTVASWKVDSERAVPG